MLEFVGNNPLAHCGYQPSKRSVRRQFRVRFHVGRRIERLGDWHGFDSKTHRRGYV